MSVCFAKKKGKKIPLVEKGRLRGGRPSERMLSIPSAGSACEKKGAVE